jgi:hypothetical protein
MEDFRSARKRRPIARQETGRGLQFFFARHRNSPHILASSFYRPTKIRPSVAHALLMPAGAVETTARTGAHNPAAYIPPFRRYGILTCHGVID